DVEVRDSPSVRPANLTVSAWARFDTLDSPGASQAGLQYLVFKKNSRTGTAFDGYALIKHRVNGTDRLAFVISAADGTQVVLDSTTAVVAGVFYNVAATYDGQTARLHGNGVLEASRSATFPLAYGARPVVRGGTGESFDGKRVGAVDDRRLWGVARSAREIAADFDRAIDPHAPGLAVYLPLDDGSGTTATDATGRGNGGTLVAPAGQ